MEEPTVLLVVGMAGSGKTRLTQRLFSHLHATSIESFMINLDPAVLDVPYSTDVDIRESIDYKEVMKECGLGPNGGIITCLNLLAAQFDKVLESVAQFAVSGSGERFVVADTPGQIEVFTWSASGTIITDTLASMYPTVMVYVIDTTRSQDPATFVANMLYACNILYKTRLPLVVVFNKTDETRHEYAVEWMTDYEKLQEAIYSEASFMSSLVNSMSLMLEEFYVHLKAVGVSSLTGDNMDGLLEAIRQARQTYQEYRAELRSQNKEQAQEDLQRLVRDISLESVE